MRGTRELRARTFIEALEVEPIDVVPRPRAGEATVHGGEGDYAGNHEGEVAGAVYVDAPSEPPPEGDRIEERADQVTKSSSRTPW
ncbi:MAG: hypothetical protein XD72_0296 [Methanothrix harundinacea]|uniref:Uncharacterized protein n=1 Tax=Methanothrix harundinacea TaxID=301375 RepID=A0A124G3G7_9EURY|nr:MAG: hypothetical protein XD72_0296 [Methanothrix harundinacea]KUK96895.1 MAG: hypothetical protein XE07_0667 [Methanothrix harundinacea]